MEYSDHKADGFTGIVIPKSKNNIAGNLDLTFVNKKAK